MSNIQRTAIYSDGNQIIGYRDPSQEPTTPAASSLEARVDVLEAAPAAGFSPLATVSESDFCDLNRNVVHADGTINTDGYVLRGYGGGSAMASVLSTSGATVPDFGFGHAKTVVVAANDCSTVRFGALPFLVGHAAAQGDGLEVIARVAVSTVPLAAGETADSYIGCVDNNTASGALDAGFGFKITADDTGAELVAWAFDGGVTVVTATPIAMENGTFYWVRAAVSGWDLQLYYSVDGLTWVAVGAAVSLSALSDYGNCPTGMRSLKTALSSATYSVFLDYLKVTIPYLRTGAVPA